MYRSRDRRGCRSLRKPPPGRNVFGIADGGSIQTFAEASSDAIRTI
jgi:hypothetical protein